MDDRTCGLQRGDLIIIAGRPSMGKTALALCIANHVAVTEGTPVGFFSMEMSREQVGNRLLCMHARVDSHKLRRNQLDTDDFHQLAMAVGVLTDAPLYLDDSPGMSIVTLRAKARRMAAKHDIGLIVVDYLQLMGSPGSSNRQEEVSAISRGLKALAREINVPVVCLSQLNRQSEGRTDRRPRMSDLRESGAIEQDADVIALMHREDYYNRTDEDYTPNNVAEVIIEKQRQGPTGTVKLHWHGPTTSLHNLSTSSDDQQQTTF
jgi:replicative DNA helicase